MITADLQEFYKFCQFNGPILAVDYGSRKVGLAISDPDRKIAMPYLNVAGSEKLHIAKIAEVAKAKKVSAIAIGLPVNMDGSLGPACKVVQQFASKVASITGLPIYLQDERLTSKAASMMLKEAGFSRQERDQKDDSVSASLILESTLQSISNL